MSHVNTQTRIFFVALFMALSACAPQPPVDNGKSSSNSNGTSSLLPSGGTPSGGTPGSLPTPTPTPSPTPTPTPGPSPSPSPTPVATATCAAQSAVTWMLQDTSYRIDFAASAEKRSYLCSGSLAQTAVGSSTMASSTNGNAGVLMYTCQSVNGVPTWQPNATYNPTTGEPVGVSCGIYNSTYRPTTVSRIDYRFHASTTSGAQNQMYGMSMVVRAFHPTIVDHLFSLDKTEGPGAGYILEGVGFSTVHSAATQDLGRDTISASPAGLRKVYRCNSPTRLKHYVTSSKNCDVPTDILEGSFGYLFTSASVQASSAVLIPVYRCKSNDNDFATPSLAECNSVNGTATVLGYSMQ